MAIEKRTCKLKTCGKSFLGTDRAKFCCSACRVKFFRLERRKESK